jgi:hypothetical protein
LAPNTPPDAPPNPESALALHASLLDLTVPLLELPVARRSRAPHVEHEKKTFFSLLENTRSASISQGRTFSVRREAGGAKRRAFTDAGAEGTRHQPRRDSPSKMGLRVTPKARGSGCSEAPPFRSMVPREQRHM